MLLSQICALQKTYGKTNDELEILVEGFSWLLETCSMDEMRTAFKVYLFEKDDVPTPSNILKIIKENRAISAVEPATIERLIEYRKKGIPLTSKQQEMLKHHEACQK